MLRPGAVIHISLRHVTLAESDHTVCWDRVHWYTPHSDTLHLQEVTTQYVKTGCIGTHLTQTRYTCRKWPHSMLRPGALVHTSLRHVIPAGSDHTVCWDRAHWYTPHSDMLYLQEVTTQYVETRCIGTHLTQTRYTYRKWPHSMLRPGALVHTSFRHVTPAGSDHTVCWDQVHWYTPHSDTLHLQEVTIQ